MEDKRIVKAKRVLMLTVASLSLFLIGILLGFFIVGPPGGADMLESNGQEIPDEQVDVFLNQTVMEGAVAEWTYGYTKCAHVKSEMKDIPIDAFGMSRPEVEKRLDGTVEMISDDIVKLSRLFDCYCPDHYVLRYEDKDSLGIYKNILGSDIMGLTKEINIDMSGIDSTIVESLRYGIAFNTMEKLNGFIEDLEKDLKDQAS